MLTQNINDTIEEYLARFGSESSLDELRFLIDVGADITSRIEWRGHVTCGAILLAPDGMVLMVQHRILGEWYLPGGHLESSDASLRCAALRELAEETRISQSDTIPFELWADRWPIDIDQHLIPANDERGEPAHWHWDFRYVFRSTSLVQWIEVAEVSNWRYSEVELLAPKVRDRIAMFSKI